MSYPQSLMKGGMKDKVCPLNLSKGGERCLRTVITALLLEDTVPLQVT